MPIFEYMCDKCGTKFEELVSADQDAVPCPECGGDETRKVLSVFAATSTSTGVSAPCGAPSCGSGFS